MRRASLGAAFLMARMSAFGSIAQTAPCMLITLTGTQGGPPAFKGLAGPGTLVRYGEDSNNCSAVKLQFDTGRGTVMWLAELNIAPEQLNAVFFTHMHNDHTEGFADLVTLRWMFFGKIDAVCTSDSFRHWASRSAAGNSPRTSLILLFSRARSPSAIPRSKSAPPVAPRI